ncbi:MAG: branched-chain amino acid ABC transporter permease [Nitrospiraceae bacterium]|nr:branched-chain amino acid ABC transporter permease [Nitrospiraceae bacterium]
MESVVSTGLIGLSLGSQYAMIAVGFTLIFGIMGVINFMHGGGYVLGGYFTYALVSSLGFPFPLAVVAAAIGTAAVGYLIEVIFVDKYVDDHNATMLITLGVYLVMTTVLIVIFGPEPVSGFGFPVRGTVRAGGFYIPYSSLIVLIICTIAILGMYYLIYRTRYGIALRAMADDRAIATAQGIRPSRMFPMAFALAMALAGLTGALVTPILVLDPHLGEGQLLKAFIVVILGGLGSIGGATVAALVIGMVEAFSSVYLGGSKGALVLFLIVLLILLVRPTGLMGREARRA